MAEEGTKYKVQLAVYDMSQGMARQLGPALLGVQIEGIWHTGVVVYGKEHFFGGGVVSVPHEEFLASYHMQPTQMLDMGETEIPEEIFDDWLREISPRYTVATYDLLRHNCNNFSDEAVTFLLGTGIPRHIVDLPEQIFSTPLGMMLRPMVEQMQTQMRPGIPGFESYGNEPVAFAPPNAAPPMPPFAFPPMGGATPAVPSFPVAPPVTNPWATPVAPAPQQTPTQPPPAPAPAPAPPVNRPSLLAAHSKPLLSSDPPQALEKSLGVISTKLRGLAPNSTLEPEDEQLLADITTALLKADPLPPSALSLVYRILTEWQSKAQFPCLSLLRLLLLQPSVYASSAPDDDLKNVLKHLLIKLAEPEGFSSKPSSIMALCSLSNALSEPAGQALLLEADNASLVVDAGLTALKDDRPEVRQMGSALLANQALAMEGKDEYKGTTDVGVQSLCGCLEGLGGEQDNMTTFRRLLCVGRLLKLMGPEGNELVTSLGFDEIVRSVGKKKGSGDVADLSDEIVRMLAG